MLSVRNLSVVIGGQPILKDITLDFRPGEVTLITGHNGAGKSTFLKALFGLIPSTGSIRHSDFPWPHSSASMAQNGIAFLPQTGAVFGSLSVRDNLALFSANGRAHEAAGHAPRLPPGALAHDLSGGERQLLALARFQYLDPRVLLLDEPTAGLSGGARASALADTLPSASRSNCVTILVEHNIRAVLDRVQRVIILRHGEVAGDHPREGLDVSAEGLARLLT